MSRLACLPDNLRKRAEEIYNQTKDENQAIVEVLNEEYNDLISKLSSFGIVTDSQQQLITILQQKSIEASQEQEKVYEGAIYDLAQTENKEGKNISELLSEFLTAYVDIAKDPYILEINAVTELANPILMMVRQGIPLKTIFYFMNQPVIKDYIKEMSLINSVSFRGKKPSKSDVIRNVLSKYGAKNVNPMEFIYKVEEDIENGAQKESKGKIYSDFTDAELIRGLEYKERNVSSDHHVKVLDIFLEIERQSGKFQDMIKSSDPDTRGFKTYSMLESQVRSRTVIENEDNFINYDKLFEGFVGKFFEIKEDYMERLRDYFISQSVSYKPYMDSLKDLIVKSTNSAEEQERMFRTLENDLIIYLAERTGLLDQGNVIENYYKGKNSIPRKIVKLQNLLRENGDVNFWLNNVVAILHPEGSENLDALKPLQKKFKAVDLEVMMSHFKWIANPNNRQELNEITDMPEEEDFITKLSQFIISQSGASYSPYNLTGMLPSSEYLAIVKKALEIARSDVDGKLIHDFVSGLDENVGSYMLNNMSSFYKGTYRNGLSIRRNKVTGEFYINYKDGGYEAQVYQRKHPNLKDYRDTATQEKRAPRNEGNNQMSLFQLGDAEVKQINPELEKTLKGYLRDLGVDVKYVDSITDENGDPINAYGKADIINKVISLVNGEISGDTLAEETAHMITALLGRNHPIIRQMMAEIPSYDVYNQVKSEYKGVYTTEEQFRFEAVGKLIGRHIFKKASLSQSQRAETTSWWNRLMRVLRNFLSNFTFSNVKKEMDIFEKMADDILAKKYSTSDLNIEESTIDVLYKDKKLADIAQSYNMKTNGFMSSQINPDAMQADLNRAGFTNVRVTPTNNRGGYYLLQDGKKINPFSNSLYQLKKTTQKEVLDTLNEVASTMKGMGEEKFVDAEGNQWYIDAVTGQAVEDRVTAKVSRETFEKGKTQKQLQDIREQPSSIFSKKWGILSHNYNEGAVNYLLSGGAYSNLKGNPDRIVTRAPQSELPDHITGKLAQGAIDLLDHISKEQDSIDKAGQAVVLTEQSTRGLIDGKDTAGTMDVIVVYSDGTVSLYDYKFISFKKELRGGKWEMPDIIPWYKKNSFESQIGIYKRILQQHGIESFRDTRILPNNLELEYDRKAKKFTGGVKNIEVFNAEGERYLMPLPVQKELTKNGTLDNILKVLFKQLDRLDVLARKNYRDKAKLYSINAQRESIANVIQDIQVKSDVSGLVETMSNILKNEQDIINSANSIEDVKELYNMHQQLGALASIQNFITASITDEAVNQKAFEAFGKMGATMSNILDKIRDLFAQENPEIKKEQRELGWWSANTAHLSKIAQPAFEIARKYIKDAWGSINTDTERVVQEANTERDLLAKWARENGMSLMDAYRKITNPKNGNLIYTFSTEFYESRKKAWEEQDIKWLAQQYEITEEHRKRFEKDLAEKQKELKVQGLGQTAYDRALLRWRHSNDLNMPSAWLNPWALKKYATVKNPSQWYSPEYKNLLKSENTGLKRYYDWYVKWNKIFNGLSGISENVGKSFVANIHKDTIDQVAQNGLFSISPKESLQHIQNSLRIRQNDVMGMEDGDTIPLLYYDNFMYKDKDGNWVSDVKSKNEDLTYNMIMFAGAAFRKHHMSGITDIMDALKLHLSEQEVIETNALGTPKRDKTTGIISTRKSDTNLKTFDAIIKGSVYGQKLQNEDIPININGTEYSGTKVVKHIMSWLSAKALGFNYVSAFGNLAGGHANIFIKAVGGKFFTKKQLSKSWEMMINRKKHGNIFHHASEYFKIEKERWVQRDAARLSASSITRNLTYDKIYILQQKGDEMIGNVVLMSMMQNYGIDENGKIKRLAQLPEGSKSILDRTTIKDDKITVDGLTPEAFNDFRGRVMYQSRQIKGTNTQEDISAMQTTLAGQVLLQFRSWLAPMVSERYGRIKYTKEVEEWEVGRYNSLVRTLVGEKFVPNIIRLMADVTTLGIIKYKGGGKELLAQQHKKFLEDNPDMNISESEYIELRERTIREAMVEARMIAGMMVLLMFAKSDWDDDGRANYTETFTTRQIYKLMNRAYLELSFFSNPTSFNALIKDPIPILSVGQDIIGLGTNTLTETFDTIATPFGYDNSDDKKHKLHYTKKLVVGVRFLEQLYDDYVDTKDK